MDRRRSGGAVFLCERLSGIATFGRDTKPVHDRAQRDVVGGKENQIHQAAPVQPERERVPCLVGNGVFVAHLVDETEQGALKFGPTG